LKTALAALATYISSNGGGLPVTVHVRRGAVTHILRPSIFLTAALDLAALAILAKSPAFYEISLPSVAGNRNPRSAMEGRGRFGEGQWKGIGRGGRS
jgi:hypothetical protein